MMRVIRQTRKPNGDVFIALKDAETNAHVSICVEPLTSNTNAEVAAIVERIVASFDTDPATESKR